MRKRVQSATPAPGRDTSRANAIDLGRLATVIVSSELPEHPVENALEGATGRGSARWIAGEGGAQSITLAFDAPQAVSGVDVEIEDTEQERTQELELAISRDGAQSYQVAVRQEFNFSPSGSTWERETWRIDAPATTHLRLTIVPHKGGGEARAVLTSLVLH
jgi:hypothetical protein